MNWRREELAHFGDQLVWLDDPKARRAYESAMSLTSKARYGLDPTKFEAIESLDVDDPGPGTAEVWLTHRIGDSPVLVVFDQRNVAKMNAGIFIENWRDWLLPSRDDAVILPERGNWGLFYCHEDVFEFGRRVSQ